MTKRTVGVLFLTVGIIAGITGSAYAQQNIAINVSARIISSVELLTIQSMKLSQADAQNQQITINPRVSPNAGKMVAVGSPNSKIRISFLKSRVLTQQNGTGTLLFNYKVAVNTVDDQNTAEILDQDNRDLTFNNNGRLYLWIGGNVDISTAAPGNYQGEFTLEIVYI